jgi:hypothetical protein
MFADPNPAVAPEKVTAFTWGSYAAEAMAKATNLGNATPLKLGPLASFARDLIAYSTEHPEDTTAGKYAQFDLEKG